MVTTVFTYWLVAGLYYALVVLPACHYVAYRTSLWTHFVEKLALPAPEWALLLSYLISQVVVVLFWPYFLVVKFLHLLLTCLLATS
jgi:hypothetical protein